MSEREQFWRERIEWQQWSGLTVAECCEEAGVSVASFYRWKKLLAEPQVSRRPRSTRRSTQRTEVQASGPKKRASQFVPIGLRDSSTSPGPPQSIASHHGNSMRIEMPNGVIIHGWSEAGRCDHRARSDPQRSCRHDNARSFSA